MSTSAKKGSTSGGGSGKSKEEATYNIRDIVLGKVRGFPPWPGIVVSPSNVAAKVRKERPKKSNVQFYCVQFFPAGDHAWLAAKDISKLQVHEMQAYINEPHKKSGDLLTAYKIALDPTEWEAEKKAEREAEEAELAAAEGEEDVDELDSAMSTKDEDGAVAAAGSTAGGNKSKKRKRESDAASVKSKASTKKNAGAKKEKDAGGAASTASAKKAGGAGGTRSRKNSTKSKAMVESEDEGEDDAGESVSRGAGGPKKADNATPPPNKKVKRDKEEDDVDPALANDPEAQKVREWRHKLQKLFLGKAKPKDEDMPGIDQLFTTVETYDKMEYRYLQFSKIGKVMRHIAILTDDLAPRDEEFNFRSRAQNLVDKWQTMYGANKKGGGRGDGAPTTPAPAVATNGNGASAMSVEGGADAEVNGLKDHSMASPLGENQSGPLVDGGADAASAGGGAEAQMDLGDITMTDIGDVSVLGALPPSGNGDVSMAEGTPTDTA